MRYITDLFEFDVLCRKTPERIYEIQFSSGSEEVYYLCRVTAPHTELGKRARNIRCLDSFNIDCQAQQTSHVEIITFWLIGDPVSTETQKLCFPSCKS